MRIKNPIVLIYAVWRIFLWFCQKLIVKVGFNRILIKNKRPAYLKKEIRKGKDQKTCVKNIKLSFNLSSNNLELPTKICLAGRELGLSGERIPWQTEFYDIEDLFALHRWGWLLRLLVEFPNASFCTWAKRELEIWLNKFSIKKQGPVWEAYSVSERIVNGILFFSLCSEDLGQKFKDKFILAIDEHANFLEDHLEYHGEKRTNNHFLNNARALYFAGQFLQKDRFSETGRLILLNELPKMLTPVGFLREESSHYHFLLTRSVLEVWWLARETDDAEFAQQIEKYALKMVERCYFFLVKHKEEQKFEIPLIGDVSPDFSPDWLIYVPFSRVAADLLIKNGHEFLEQRNEKNDWARLFGERLFILQKERAKQEFYIADGWLRLNKSDITIFWPIKPKGAVNITCSHGHNDLNSFCLYYRGQPVIIDIGRYSFAKTELDRYGRKTSAHNSILIDNKEQFILDWYGILPFWALAEDVQVEHKKVNDDTDLVIKTKDFCRTFSLQTETNTLIIKDKFLGKGKHRLDSFFHLAPDIQVSKVNDRKFVLKKRELNFDLQVLSEIRLKSELKNDYFFPAYGQKTIASRITFGFSINFPQEIKYQINWR